MIIQITDTLRLEDGPARRTAVAGQELDQGRLPDGKAVHRHYKIGSFDAAGKVIELNKPFEYLDYEAAKVWYIYRLENGRWERKGGFFEDMELALQEAVNKYA